MQNSIAVLNKIFPPHMVPSQLKILIPVGMPTIIEVIAKGEGGFLMREGDVHPCEARNAKSADDLGEIFRGDGERDGRMRG